MGGNWNAEERSIGPLSEIIKTPLPAYVRITYNPEAFSSF